MRWVSKFKEEKPSYFEVKDWLDHPYTVILIQLKAI